MRKIILFVLMIYSANTFAGNYYFEFYLGIGSDSAREILIYYQITEKSGKKRAITPFSIKDMSSLEILKINFKKSKVKLIDFEGFIIEKNGDRKPILKLQSNINSINAGKNKATRLDLIAIELPNVQSKPLTEFISEIERKTYLNILKKPEKEPFNYNNFFPLGKFILYDPKTKNSIDAITINTESKEFIQSSKSIKDHYLLKKKADANLDVKYTKLANASFNRNKQQYIEYLIEIKKMEVLHWQSNKSESEYLYERYKNNNLGIISNSFRSNPDYKLYFVSSCTKIKDFTVSSTLHDSIATTTKVNIDIPGNPFITVDAGVVYMRDEAATTIDSTQIFYTGFRVRDYTDFVNGLISDLDKTSKLKKAKNQMKSEEQNVISLFKNLREIDDSFVNFTSVDVIARFFENIQLKEIITNETLEADTNLTIENNKILGYNATLEELKESIVKYKNAKNYKKELEISFSQNTNIVKASPKEIGVDDAIIESLAKNGLSN